MSTENKFYQTKHREKKLITIKITVLFINDKTFILLCTFFKNSGYFKKEHYDISIGRYRPYYSIFCEEINNFMLTLQQL